MRTYDPHKSTNEVRQGNRRMMNSRVLLISMTAAIVAFGLIYFLFLQSPPAA